jgi:hypothetical protein
MAATSFSFINGSLNCDHRAGYLVFERPWWREAAGGHCDYRRLIKLIRTPANKSALPSGTDDAPSWAQYGSNEGGDCYGQR